MESLGVVLPTELSNKYTREGLKPPNSIQWKLPSTTWEKLIRDESEKLKYPTPHHI